MTTQQPPQSQKPGSNAGQAAGKTNISTNKTSTKDKFIIDQMNRIFRGDLHSSSIELPKPTLRLIRLFVVSNYSDFCDEREIFWSDIYAELQHYCVQYTAELLVIDPFQGVDSNDIAADSDDLELLLKELNKCNEKSAGIFFLALLGDKYGPCCSVRSIRPEEFTQIKTCALESHLDVKLLDSWYKLDQNAPQHVYQLQKTNSKGKTLDSKTAQSLLQQLQKAAKIVQQEGLKTQLNSKLQDRYFTSGIDRCVQTALACRNDYERCLIVMRKFSSVNPAVSTVSVAVSATGEPAVTASTTKISENTKAAKITEVRKSVADFLDLPESSEAFNPSEKIGNLKNWISGNLDKHNVECFNLNFNPESNSWTQTSKEKQRYLDKYLSHVSYKLKHLVEKSLADLDSSSAFQRELTTVQRCVLSEAHFHLDYAANVAKSATLVGRKELVAKIGEHCRQALKRKIPLLLLKGEDGVGKTALICEVMQQLPDWLKGQKLVVIPRFCGLSPGSQMTHELLRHVCLQLSYAFGLSEESTEAYRAVYQVNRLSSWLANLLDLAAVKSTVVALLFDDLHLLKTGHYTGGRGFSWLPSNLPLNVVAIYTIPSSLEPESLPIIAVPNDNSCAAPALLSIDSLTESHFAEIVKNQLSRKQRTLTSEQLNVAAKTLKANKSLAFATVLAYEAEQWPSGYSPNGHGIAAMLNAHFETLLAKLEKTFGSEVISFACSYVECTQFGISETELLDLLSLNRDVMDKLFPHAEENGVSDVANGINGSGGCCRFPALLWIKIKHHLWPFLDEIVLDDRLLIKWKHSVYSTVVRHRYLPSSVAIKRVNNDMAELFLNIWDESGHSGSAVRTHHGTQRLVFPQHLKVSSPQRDQDRYNLRRIRELWYHLLHSGDIEQLKEQALCNFEFLQALLDVGGVVHLQTVFETVVLQILHYDFHIFYNVVLRPSVEALSQDGLLLAAETIGRLRYTRDANSQFLNNLVDQAMAWVDNYSTTPLLVPLTCWLSPPKSPLAISFQMQNWKTGSTIIQPTLNYQHVLVTGGKESGTIRMYHVASQTLVRTFPGHSERVLCMAMSNGGHFFVTAGLDKTVKTWDLIHGIQLNQYMPHLDRVNCILLTKDDMYLITGSQDCTIKLSDLESGKVLKSFEDHSGPVLTLAINYYDEILISGSSDFTVKVWNLHSGKKLNRIGGLMAPVNQVCLSSNDAFLLVSCEDETIHVFSLVTCQELHELRGHDGKACCMDTAHDDCQVFVGSSDGFLYVYDMHDGQLLDKRACNTYPITSAKITSDSRFLITACADSVHVWNIEKRDCKQITLQHFEQSNVVTSVVMSSDGKYAATGSYLGYIQLWDLELCVCLWSALHNPQQKITALAFTNDAMHVISGTEQGQVFVWNGVTGLQTKHYGGHRSGISAIISFIDNNRIASLDTMNGVHVWTLQETQFGGDDQQISALFTFKGAQQFLLLSNIDKEIISKSSEFEKEARIWTISDEGVTVKSKPSHVDAITTMSTTKDGRFLVTASKDHSLKVWEIATGFITQILVAHNATVTSCAISDDGRTVISGCENGQVIAWDVPTGTAKLTFQKHKKAVGAVAIASDGSIALGGGEDGWIYCWGLENGSCYASFNAHRAVNEMFITADAGRIILKLDKCPRLPIVCLHNSPAGLHLVPSSRKMSRNLSVSSSGSGISQSSMSQAGTALGTSQDSAENVKSALHSSKTKPKPLERKGSRIFAHLERSRSRASLYGDNPTITTKVVSEKSSSTNNGNGAAKAGKGGDGTSSSPPDDDCTN